MNGHQTRSMAHRLHQNLCRNLLRKDIQVTDNPDVAVYNMMQLLEGIHHAVTEASVELADAFVNEDEIGGDALQSKIGEPQCQGDGDEEAFTAGDHLHGARCIS